MSYLLQCMLVPGDAGGVPVFPDAVEFLAHRFRLEVARSGGRVHDNGEPNRASDDGHAPVSERAIFSTADAALAAVLAIARAIQSPERRPPVPMPFRAALDFDALPDDAVWHERFSACSAVCAAGNSGQVLATEAFAGAVTATIEPVSLVALQAARLEDLAPSQQLYQLRHRDLVDVYLPLQTLNDVPNNLRPQQTHFVGRAKERRAVQLLLLLYRLVTIVGGGGIGKTRLALQVAASNATRFPDGVWLVELASARHAVQVAVEIASAIGLEDAVDDPLALVAARLAPGRCLLILDNCEFDPLSTSAVAEHLIAVCPGLHILAVSRRALECPSEQPFVLAPMNVAEAIPASGPPTSDAARLFVDRTLSRAARTAFGVGDAAIVERLCVLLDGNPLAIELAAARLGAWDLTTLYDRIAQRFDALGENPSAQHPRQRSLWATIDWSYQLLGPAARRMFELFSVFRGGADREAILQVAGVLIPDADVQAALDELTDVFLLEARTDNGWSRWDMLTTIRAFASERLTAGDAGEPAHARHAGWFTDVAARSTELINGPDQAAIVRRLALEHWNLRAALEWHEARPNPTDGLRMSVALRRYWACAGHFSEGRHHLETLLLRTGDVDERLKANALHSLATLSSRQSDFARARECLDEALVIAEREGDGHLIGKVRNAFGNLAMLTGDVATAREHFAAALTRMQALEHEVGIIAVLNNLAMVETTLGNLAAAAEYFETCLELAREIGYSRGIADALNNLGVVLGMRSDYSRTRRVLAECVAILQQIGERRRLALAMVNLAHAALRQGRIDDARALCLEALAIQYAVGDRGGTAQTRLGLGMAALFGNALDEAAGYLEDALGIMRGLDERHPDEAEVVLGLGEIARRRGDLDGADRLFQESLVLSARSGDLRHRALAQLALGRAGVDAGRPDMARAALLDGLALLTRLGSRRGMIEGVEIMAQLEPAPVAARLLGAAEAERRAIGAPLPPHEAVALDALRATLESVMGKPAALAARSDGEARGLDPAIAALLG